MRRPIIGAAVASIGIAALVMVGAGAGISAGASGSRAAIADLVARPVGGGVMVRSDPHRALPVHGGTTISSNWSGYAVNNPAGPVTEVTSTFVVPTAGLIPPGFGATWTGIGGYSSQDLIQAGVEEDSLPLLGNQYFAWYELIPASETPLTDCYFDSSCTVHPGDSIYVRIQQIGATEWNVFMMDANHWIFSKNLDYTSTRSSAEWILEAPTVIVQSPTISADNMVPFGPTSTYSINGGAPQSIASGNPTQIDLSLEQLGLLTEATPSPLDRTGQSFNDCTYMQSCPAPTS
jgi:hypothetical protein